ncbi:MAG: hypothetical protein AAGC99_11455 [Pseudomonadota bacterium]
MMWEQPGLTIERPEADLEVIGVDVRRLDTGPEQIDAAESTYDPLAKFADREVDHALLWFEDNSGHLTKENQQTGANYERLS